MDIFCIHHHHDRLLPIINWDLLCDGFILLSTVLWLTRYKILQKIIYGYPLITIRIIFCAINISVLVQSLLVCKTISYCMYNLGNQMGAFFSVMLGHRTCKICYYDLKRRPKMLHVEHYIHNTNSGNTLHGAL